MTNAAATSLKGGVTKRENGRRELRIELPPVMPALPCFTDREIGLVNAV